MCSVMDLGVAPGGGKGKEGLAWWWVVVEGVERGKEGGRDERRGCSSPGKQVAISFASISLMLTRWTILSSN